MSSSIASTIMILFFIPSFFLLISTPTTTSSSPLIDQICAKTTKDYGVKTCTQILESQPKVASATNLFDLAAAILESGISSSANTLAHIQSLLEKGVVGPNLKGAVQDCKTTYDGVVGMFNAAGGYVKNKAYGMAIWVLTYSKDDYKVCERAVAKGIKDEIISSENSVVPIFVYSALEIVGNLSSH